jgi:DNA-binding CsgD family transcriptional regulator
VHLLGAGIAEIVDTLSLRGDSTSSVSRMQPSYRFDPESTFTTRLATRAAGGELSLAMMVDAVTETRHPLLFAIAGAFVRVAPIFIHLTVLDSRHVVCAGPTTDEGDVTAWCLIDSRLREQALDLWRDASTLARPLQAPTTDAHLSFRQLQVARRMCIGTPDRAIARELGVSVRSVERDVARLLDYLGAGSRAEAILLMLGRHANTRGVEVRPDRTARST